MTMEKHIQDKICFIEDYKKASNAATGSKYDANANITEKNLAVLSYELPKKDNIELQRAILTEYIRKNYGDALADQYIKDLNHHIIYRHDESSGAGGFPYCCAISLYPFLLNGLKDLGGSSLPPKHTASFVGGLINLIFLVAGQFVGAVAIPETFTYFDHFLRKDYGEDYAAHLDDVVEIGANRKLTLREKICDWFQQFVYTINQPAGARGYQSVFFNIAYFDKYYFESIFKDFFFPDGDVPSWESTKELQKLFMKWFNKERTKSILTFPVESFSILVDKETGEYKDEETADFIAEMWAEGHSFFVYQSDSPDSLSSCCRLRSGLEDNVFSYTLGAGGVETGSKAVITMNVSRIVQDWDREGRPCALSERIAEIADRVRAYLISFDHKLRDDYDAGLLTVYKAGFIDLRKQYLTIGVQSFLEAAEYLGIDPKPENEEYGKLAKDILGTLKKGNKAARTDDVKFNLEFVPGENLGVKNYNWDKKDGYWVPESRNLYNSYFYPVEDPIDPVRKFYYQGTGFTTECDGGAALHNNLEEHLSKRQYRLLMDVAVRAGCNYFTFNVPNTVCRECGHISKHYLDHCEECGSTEIDYATRIIGYLKLVSNFSEPRQIEASKRYYGKPEEKEREKE